MSYGVNASTGFMPYGRMGASYFGGSMEFQIPAAFASNIFRGTPLALTATGEVGLAVAGTAGNRRPFLGVAIGFKYQTPLDLSPQSKSYWPAGTVVAPGTTAFVEVIVDPYQMYSIQTVNGAGLALTNIGNTCSVANIGAGSPSSGQSACVLDLATAGVDAALDCKIIGLDPDARNSFGQLYNNAIVMLNNPFFSLNQVGI